MNYIAGKHIFIQPPNLKQGEAEVVANLNKRKKNFIEKANMLYGKKISFRNITQKEVEKSIYNIKHVIFEVTEKCNLACVYCTFGKMYNDNETRLKEKHNLKKEDALKLLEHLYLVWKEREQKGLLQEITLGFYGGEPLLNFSLIKDIVQWAKEHTTPQLTFKFQLTTNGLLLKKHIDFLIKYDFITHISLDGNEENMAYRIDLKGKNCFKQVFDNIMEVKENFPVFFDKKVFLLTVLHNKNSTEQAVHFCMTHFNKLPLCSNLNESGIHSKKKALFDEMSEVLPTELSKETKKAMMNIGAGLNETISFIYYFSGFQFNNYNALLQRNENDEVKKNPAGVCIPFSKKLYMTINGNLYPCERINTCFSLGNIHDVNVLDTEQITSLYNQYFNNILPVCNVCKHNYSCNNCLFRIDGIQGKQAHCSKILNQEKFNEMFTSIVALCKKHPYLYVRFMKHITPAI
jgi:uncharacterized protein